MIMPATRTCREFMMLQAYADSKSRVNCATCVKWDREREKCADIANVVQRYEDMPGFAEFDRMMRDARSIIVA